MIAVENIKTELLGLVGINQPYDPDYAIFEPDLLLSESGLFLDDVNFVTGEFIIDVVSPLKSTTPQKNEVLRNLMKSASIQVVNEVFDKSSLIDHGVLYSKANNFKDLQDGLPNGFIGWKLKITETKDVSFKINRVFLELEGNGDLELILWNTNRQNPIETETIAITSGNNAYTIDLNWECRNLDFYKGDWYIGYIYDGSIIPFKREYHDSSEVNDIRGLWMQKVVFSDHNVITIPDLDKEAYLGSQSTGINMDITVFEDKTSFVIQNKLMFAKAIQLKTAILIFQKFLSSTRSNVNERYSKDFKRSVMAFMKGIKGEGIQEKGLEPQLISEITRIKQEIEKLKEGVGTSKSIKVNTLF